MPACRCNDVDSEDLHQQSGFLDHEHQSQYYEHHSQHQLEHELQPDLEWPRVIHEQFWNRHHLLGYHF